MIHQISANGSDSGNETMPYNKADRPQLPWLDVCFTGFVFLVGISAIILLIHG